jgi:hypothetical protein
MSLGQGSERQTSRAAVGPGPSLWRQTTTLFHAALREALVNNKGKYKRRQERRSPGFRQPAEIPGKNGGVELVQCKTGRK